MPLGSAHKVVRLEVLVSNLKEEIGELQTKVKKKEEILSSLFKQASKQTSEFEKETEEMRKQIHKARDEQVNIFYVSLSAPAVIECVLVALTIKVSATNTQIRLILCKWTQLARDKQVNIFYVNTNSRSTPSYLLNRFLKQSSYKLTQFMLILQVAPACVVRDM